MGLGRALRDWWDQATTPRPSPESALVQAREAITAGLLDPWVHVEEAEVRAVKELRTLVPLLTLIDAVRLVREAREGNNPSGSAVH